MVCKGIAGEICKLLGLTTGWWCSLFSPYFSFLLFVFVHVLVVKNVMILFSVLLSVFLGSAVLKSIVFIAQLKFVIIFAELVCIKNEKS